MNKNKRKMCFIVLMTTSSLVLLIPKVTLQTHGTMYEPYTVASLTTEKPPDHLGITNMLCFIDKCPYINVLSLNRDRFSSTAHLFKCYMTNHYDTLLDWTDARCRVCSALGELFRQWDATTHRPASSGSVYSYRIVWFWNTFEDQV